MDSNAEAHAEHAERAKPDEASPGWGGCKAVAQASWADWEFRPPPRCSANLRLAIQKLRPTCLSQCSGQILNAELAKGRGE
jgi:hypothetical protein